MQLDDEVVQYFKKLAADGGNGERYTALVNQVLLEHVQAVREGRGDAAAGLLARTIRLELERLIAPN
ncbi:MAG: hypothetical protein MUF07_09730 [Steroidobacteraceae bacterium]|jgi:hypothetical protein|nr:hypothetical protein [Steroidobacteraceae bacterium]